MFYRHPRRQVANSCFLFDFWRSVLLRRTVLPAIYPRICRPKRNEKYSLRSRRQISIYFFDPLALIFYFPWHFLAFTTQSWESAIRTEALAPQITYLFLFSKFQPRSFRRLNRSLFPNQISRPLCNFPSLSRAFLF